MVHILYALYRLQFSSILDRNILHFRAHNIIVRSGAVADVSEKRAFVANCKLCDIKDILYQSKTHIP